MPFAELRYFSPALQKSTTCNLILPEAAAPRPWRAMLLLHGLSDDQSIWSRRTSVERYVEGWPLVVVMPDGGRGFYCDALEGYAYYTALAEELPTMIERTFGVEGEWGVAGLSMGGYGAVRFALGRPDKFTAAVSHSGAVGFAHYPEGRDDAFMREFRRVVGDRPTDGPNDLFALAKATKSRPRLRIDCGVDDFLIEMNRDFHRHLLAIGYPHEYEEFSGEHTWSYWDEHVQEALVFLRREMAF